MQGELATLVAAEEQRRAEAEAVRVQAELAAKAEKAAKAEAEAKAARERSRAQKAASDAARSRHHDDDRPKPAAASPASPSRLPPPPPPTTTAKPTTTTAPSEPSGGRQRCHRRRSRRQPMPPSPRRGANSASPTSRGGAGPGSFDCSGLTSWAWRAGGEQLSHSSRAQWSETSRVAMSAIQPGDLLFYGSPIHHVGLYVGNGQMIEAPETGKNVRTASIYRSDFVGAGRIN